mmetsp:Transcript_43568/g.100360  ORF Transcript_43568/g.100360 Transcript_43568/m.100360 type:complete len:223 (-) Transcript_43568:961-1629(-)
MMSSTRMIISAASAAAQSCDILLLKDSRMPFSSIFPMSALGKSRPQLLCPLACAARSLPSKSAESRPPLSAMIAGICCNAFAKCSMAMLSFPDTFPICSSTAADISISMAPPPWTTLVSVTVWYNTAKASCNDRSASSKTWVDAPLRTMAQASPCTQPENLITLSSPIIISSILSQKPSCALSGSSKVDRMSAPSTAANRSVPSKSECSMAITPASLNSWSG